MRNLNWNSKASLLFFGVLFIVIGLICLGVMIRENRVVVEEGTVAIMELEEEADFPLVDISYEDMRVYIFPDNGMLTITFPKYVKEHPSGAHTVITIDENGIVKATTINRMWYYLIIYCKKENVLLEKERKKLKEKKGY